MSKLAKARLAEHRVPVRYKYMLATARLTPDPPYVILYLLPS